MILFFVFLVKRTRPYGRCCRNVLLLLLLSSSTSSSSAAAAAAVVVVVAVAVVVVVVANISIVRISYTRVSTPCFTRSRKLYTQNLKNNIIII